MFRAGDVIVLGVLSLLCVGVVMVNSAGLTIDPQEAVTVKSIIWSRSSFYMVAAMAAMLLICRLPIDRLSSSPALFRAVPLILPGIFLLLLLVYAPVIGREVNGSHRWVHIPGTGFSMQPSEIAKWGLLIVLAWHGARAASRMHEFKAGLLPGLLIVGLFAALIAKEDLGTGVLVAMTGAIVLIAAGARLWQLGALVPAALGAIALAVIVSPYRVKRLVAFLDPYADPEGAGYHMIQSLVAVANGEGFGRGLGFGLQKFGYLPEDRTDFLFAVICEELGVGGAAVIVALYAGILVSACSIVLRQQDRFLKLLGLGVTTTFGLQALINLFVVTGLAPTKGIALPLLSSGGTGWIMTAASLGILVAMDRRTAARESEAIQPGLVEPKPVLATVEALADPSIPAPIDSRVATPAAA